MVKQSKAQQFIRLTPSQRAEILENPAYSRILSNPKNRFRLKFFQDSKSGWVILNYLDAFTITKNERV